MDEMKGRLDRSVATYSWTSAFQNAKGFHLTATNSDHSPILTDLNFNGRRVKKKVFRFEPVWLRQDGFSDILIMNWRCSLNQGGQLVNTLKNLGSFLKDWSLSSLGNVKNRISHLKKNLETLRNSPRTDDTISKESELVQEIDE